jgi:hypothetical protein
MPVQGAYADLRLILIRWQDEHDLTNTEAALGVAEQLQHIHRRLLRAERHPAEPDRKADEA